MKKILFVNLYKEVGGGEIYLRRLISRLLETSNNFDIYIATPKNKEIINKSGVLENKIIRIKGLLGNRKLNDLLYFYSSIKQINKLLDKKNIDIVVLNGTRAIYMAPFLNKETKKIGVKHMLIEDPFFNIKKYINKFAINYLNKLVTISKFHINQFNYIFGNKNRLELIYNGVNIKKFSSKKNEKKSDDEIVFFEAASLIKRKGQLDLIKAFKNLNKKYPNTKLLFAGDGKLKDEIKVEIERYNLEDKVEMLGFVENIELIYKNIDVFILPSYSEGFPLSILEAMSFSKPIISTEVAGIPEMIKDGKEGFLIKPGDIGNLEKKMLFFIENKDLINKMGSNAREKVEAEFSENKMIKKWQDNLENI